MLASDEAVFGVKTKSTQDQGPERTTLIVKKLNNFLTTYYILLCQIIF
jgi:hypothetical protein